ncbi:MAG: efflux RND transporter permease subunit [Hyphomicrobiales bacterium]|nr:efflux RND transporter permease subunit [Hyphomicrobiales bacterium]
MSSFNLSRWAIEHRSFTGFLLILLLASGAFSLFNLGQKEDPDFTFRVMVVRVLWPGATVQEMQDQVVDKIETKLQETPKLDYVRSYSRPGEATIFVNILGEAKPAEIENAFYQVRKKVGDIRNDLPAGVVGPFFNDEFGDTYIALYALTGKGFDYPELKDAARKARDVLLRTPGVEKVDILGDQPEKIYVEILSRVLAERQIAVSDIQNTLSGQNAMAPAGRVETTDRSVQLFIEGMLLSLSDIAELRVRAGGQTIRLGDIAKITRGTEDPPTSKIRFGGEEAVVLGVVMAPGFNVTEVGKGLQAGLKRISADLPIGLNFGVIADQPEVVQRYVGEFLISLGEALGIVLAVSFLSLGWRSGLVVALTIPLVLAVTFTLMMLLGIDLQKISLGALIIALGLLVDDAMIAVEMMQRKLEEGYDKLKAASFAYTSTAFPMLTGTLITVAGFLPVGLAQSTAGEYVRSLFIVVGVALVVSWFAAVYFTPWIGYLLLREQKNGQHHEVFNGPFYRRLRGVIQWCVRRRRLTIAFTLAAFMAGVTGFAFIPQQFFPSSNRPEVMVDMWLPEGTAFAETEREAIRLESAFKQDPDLASVTSYIGEGSPRFYLPLDQQLQNRNFAQIVLLAKDLEARERLIARARETLSTDFPAVRFKVERLNSGPPVGWPVQLRVMGPERQEVRRIATEVDAMMRAHPQVSSVHDDWLELTPVLKLSVDQDKARALGITSQAIRQTLQAVLTGAAIGEFREGDETIGVVVREPSETRNLVSTVESAYVKTSSGQSVPIPQIARATLSLEPGVEWRRNRLPTITVRGVVPDDVQSPDVAKALYAQLAPLREKLPLGYAIEMQGAVEESAISQASIFKHMPLVVLAIAFLLMVQLQHFGKSVLVFVTAPLGLIGASAALIAFSAPFGFNAILGVIALLGMIMRNSVILVDQIDQDIKAGHSPADAVVDSAVRRFRPIVLTAAAAVLAMIPLTKSIFWGAMAISMMGGLIAATVLTLTFLPALYALTFRIKTAPLPIEGVSVSVNPGQALIDAGAR